MASAAPICIRNRNRASAPAGCPILNAFFAFRVGLFADSHLLSSDRTSPSLPAPSPRSGQKTVAPRRKPGERSSRPEKQSPRREPRSNLLADRAPPRTPHETSATCKPNSENRSKRSIAGDTTNSSPPHDCHAERSEASVVAFPRRPHRQSTAHHSRLPSIREMVTCRRCGVYLYVVSIKLEW